MISLIAHACASFGAGAGLSGDATISISSSSTRNCQIRHNAYIREQVIIGDDCVVGNACEVKNSIFFNRCHGSSFQLRGRFHPGPGRPTWALG